MTAAAEVLEKPTPKVQRPVASKPHVLIAGATSDIALALAHQMAADGHGVYLAARNVSRMEADRGDIELRHRVPVELVDMDVTDTAGLKEILATLDPKPHMIVSMVGWMGEQSEQEQDPEQAAKVIAANFTGPAALMEAGAELFADMDAPTTLVGVSSVAGDRGRARNYYYGAAKGGFTSMLSGLRQRLSRTKTKVITIKPGFVATRMTEGMDLPGPLVDSAETSAKMIHRAIRKGREVVYPWKWRLVMTIIRAVPEPIFKKMKF